MEENKGIEKIKGICRPYGDQKKKVAYIREFKSYQAGLNAVRKDLTHGFKDDYKQFRVVLREFDSQTKGRESDIIPLTFSLAAMAGGGYLFCGKTAANDTVAAETHYSTYHGEITENVMRFSIFDPKVDMREVFTEFSKDKYHERGFSEGFRLDQIIGKHRIGCVESSYGFRRDTWHIEQDHPLAVAVYNNTIDKMTALMKK